MPLEPPVQDEELHQRWAQGAEAMSRLYVSLLDAPYAQYERELLALQRRFLTSCKSEWERRESRRRIAEELLMGAYLRDVPWEDFKRALRRIQRLGYTSVERRVHVAVLFARWAQLHPEHLPAARAGLLLAERHFHAVSPEEPLYQAAKESLESIRQEKEFVP
jgi:hypothetical protein